MAEFATLAFLKGLVGSFPWSQATEILQGTRFFPNHFLFDNLFYYCCFILHEVMPTLLCVCVQEEEEEEEEETITWYNNSILAVLINER